jgi:hypothetical protein
MAVSEAVVTAVVSHTSEQMKDPSFVQLSVGSFVEAQPHVSRFLSAKAARLGGAEALVQLVFHAEVLLECVRQSSGQSVKSIDFPLLDRASQGDFASLFTNREPHLANYVASNVDDAKLRQELCRIGLAMCMSLDP